MRLQVNADEAATVLRALQREVDAGVEKMTVTFTWHREDVIRILANSVDNKPFEVIWAPGITSDRDAN